MDQVRQVIQRRAARCPSRRSKEVLEAIVRQMHSKLAVDDLRGYRWMIAAFIPKIRFSLDRDLLIRGIRKGKNWFSVFNHDELRGNELERLADRFANNNHFARFDSLFEFFWNLNFDNLTRQVSRECILSDLTRLGSLPAYIGDLSDCLFGFFLGCFKGRLEFFVFRELKKQLIGVDELLSLLTRAKKADLGE